MYFGSKIEKICNFQRSVLTLLEFITKISKVFGSPSTKDDSFVTCTVTAFKICVTDSVKIFVEILLKLVVSFRIIFNGLMTYCEIIHNLIINLKFNIILYMYVFTSIYLERSRCHYISMKFIDALKIYD